MRFKLLFPILLSLLSLACLFYLIWWDVLGVYSPSYNNYEFLTDRLAGAAFLFSAFIALAGIILSFRYRGYLLTILPLLMLTGYFLRLAHGVQIASLKGCDMSICSNLDLYADGTYFFRESSQLSTTTHSGTFLLAGDTVMLSPNDHFPGPDKEERARIKESRCLILKPIGFRIEYLDRSCD